MFHSNPELQMRHEDLIKRLDLRRQKEKIWPFPYRDMPKGQILAEVIEKMRGLPASTDQTTHCLIVEGPEAEVIVEAMTTAKIDPATVSPARALILGRIRTLKDEVMARIQGGNRDYVTTTKLVEELGSLIATSDFLCEVEIGKFDTHGKKVR
jgi:hypothetical protein